MADTPAPATSTVAAKTPLAAYQSIQTILHYALGVGGLFGIGGAFAVPGIYGQLITVGISTLAMIAGPLLQKISVSHNSVVGEVLDKVDAIDAAVTGTTPAAS